MNIIRYDALTGIRFFAAFGVFVAHFGHFDFGAQGVTLFFVLSGFILVKVYTSKDWTVGQFYWARFARIYPAYLFSLLIALPPYWRAINTHESVPTFMGSVLLMLHAWQPETAHLWNNPSWSLSAEAFFYFLFPFFLPLFNLRLIFLVILIAFLWTVSIIPALWGDYSDGGQFIGKLPLLRLPEFLIGIAFGWMHGKIKSIDWRIPAFLILFVAIFMPTNGTHTFLAPIYGLLFIGLTDHKGWLSSKTMVLLGDASYSFYLLHMPIMLWFSWAERMVTGPISIWIKAPSLFFLTLLLSFFSLFLIERPTRAWLLRRRITTPN